MMRHPLVFLLAGLGLSCHTAVAQDEPPSSILGSVYISTGTFADQRFQLDPWLVRSLTPGSTLLSDMVPGASRVDRGNEGRYFSASLGLFPFRKAYREGPELRLGVLGTSELGRTGHYERSTRTPYDTLVSISSGEIFTLDSMYRQKLDVEYSYLLAGVHASLIWRTQSRLSLYGGIGAGVGAIYHSRTELEYQASSSLQKPGYWMYATGPNGIGDVEHETYSNGSGTWAQLFFPFGFDYQLHRSSEPWSRVFLFLEAAPQFLWAKHPAFGTITGPGLLSSMGVRVSL